MENTKKHSPEQPKHPTLCYRATEKRPTEYKIRIHTHDPLIHKSKEPFGIFSDLLFHY